MRRRKETRFADLWEYSAPYGTDTCTYCGDPADTIDHVAPVSFVFALNGQNLPPHAMFKVPACRNCNSLAMAYPAKSIADKRRHIQAQIKRKYRRKIGYGWTDDELAELGYNLSTHIKARENVARWIEARLGWPGNRNTERRRHFGLLTVPGVTID